MRLSPRVGPAVAVPLAIAACGGGSSTATRTVTATATSSATTGPGNVNEQPSKEVNGKRTFSAPGMAIHFEYPAAFHPVALAPSKRTAGSNVRATHSAVALGNYDLLIVSWYPDLKYPVTASNITAVKPQFDRVIGQVLGRHVSGRVGKAGGLLAIFWPRQPVAGLPVKATVMIVNAFVGKDEYELQCQATPQHLGAIEAACREMIATLTTGKGP